MIVLTRKWQRLAVQVTPGEWVPAEGLGRPDLDYVCEARAKGYATTAQRREGKLTWLLAALSPTLPLGRLDKPSLTINQAAMVEARRGAA